MKDAMNSYGRRGLGYRSPDSKSGMCSCRTPLILDRETGRWLHLDTMRPCPRRGDTS